MLSDLENFNYLIRKAYSLLEQDFAASEKIMHRAHLFVHSKGHLHLKLHLNWLKMGWKSRSIITVIKQIFPVIFAVPVSFVHRFLRSS